MQHRRPSNRRPAPQDTLATLLAGFSGPIEPTPTSLVYRIGLTLVALTMVLLPLIYVALIGVVGYGVFYHATENLDVMAGVRSSRAVFWGFLFLYVGPLVIGVLLVLFMIKPLLARRAREAAPLALKPDDEPVLFGFVARLCEVVGAPVPRRIQVDCEVNASAGFRRGLGSLFGRADLTLTIGLPLVAGFSLRQLAGVLAHEFGHFAQSAGMRLTYVIRWVNAWFARVVYERDHWDEQVVRASEELDIRFGIIFYAARLFIWATRGILWVLMMAGHAISCFMLRQMEFDADRYEARLAGSDEFERTARQLNLLGLASQMSQGELGESWQEKRLADDYPALVQANVARLPAAAVAHVESHLQEAQTGLLDTHPADPDRIASARREAAPGVFDIDQPAAVLFTDFAALSRRTSMGFYRSVLGERIAPEQLVDVGRFLRGRAEAQEQSMAAGRYFQGQAAMLRPLPISRTLPSLDPELADALIEQLRELRPEVEQTLPAYGERLDGYLELEGRLSEAKMGEALLAAKFTIDAAEFNLRAPTREGARAARKTFLGKLSAQAETLAADEEQLTRRLTLALQLLPSEPVRSALGEDATRYEAELPGLLAAADDLAQLTGPVVMPLKHELAALHILLANAEGNQANEQLGTEVRSRTGVLHKLLAGAQDLMRTMPYPFEHALGEVALARYALEGQALSGDDLQAVYSAAGTVLERLELLFSRVYGRLAVIAEAVEGAIGLEPLPEPGAGWTDRPPRP